MVSLGRSTLLRIVVIGAAWLLAAACSDSIPEPILRGSVRVAVTTTGGDLDLDGYDVTIDGQPHAVGPNETVVIPYLTAGTYTVELHGVAGNCIVSEPNAQTVSVAGGQTTDVVYAVSCVETGVRVVVATSGVDLDPDGYLVSLDGAEPLAVPANGSVSITRLAAGSHTVSLDGGLSFNCDATSPTSVTVTVPSRATVDVGFSAECRGATELAYSASTSGIPDIYAVRTNGAGLTKLTSQGYGDAPAWSPDGSKIAFYSHRDGNDEIYVMNADGSDQVRLTDHPTADDNPSWSPDGTRIAFRSDRDGNPDIFVMQSDGTSPARLTNDPAADLDPAWSPDGTKIAFSSSRTGYAAIYVMNSDGSDVTQLTTGPLDDANPSWSPDGSRIAFSRVAQCHYYYCERDLFVMNADGSGVTQLTSGDDDHDDPAWSPDGVMIAFSAARCGYYGCNFPRLKAVRSDATEIRELSIVGQHPAWRP